MSKPPSAEFEAMMLLYAELDRLGPGDDETSRNILKNLPDFPENPNIADLGCGTGHASLMLAELLDAPVRAVELSPQFLATLTKKAAASNLSHLILPIEADMSKLDWVDGELALLWSEGAAYNLTFRGALECWRPLLAKGGLAVISECCWHSDKPALEIVSFWKNAYPAMGTEDQNHQLALDCGYKALDQVRMPQRGWLENYYAPLMARMDELRTDATSAMQAVMKETVEEIELYHRYSDDYGYTFYILQAQ
ncbi:MAG: class I SAM-dependent methyltransferase [Rhizobiaceae bacterium]|nr:class I SAM-dependent methyltransferase [Rhizobiaceae bacterium]